jgi:hypothetical protein
MPAVPVSWWTWCRRALVSPRRPDNARIVRGRGILHHPVQRAGVDLFHKPDALVGSPARLTREPVPEADAREVRIGKQHRNAAPRAASGDEHFSAGDVADERTRLRRRKRIPGQRAVTDCLDGRLIEPCPAAVAKELAGFCVCPLGQDAWPAILRRRPPMPESTLYRSPLKLKIIFRALDHGGHPRGRAGCACYVPDGVGHRKCVTRPDRSGFEKRPLVRNRHTPDKTTNSQRGRSTCGFRLPVRP